MKHTVNGLTASIFQIGNGGAFCTLSIRTDPTLRISLNAEFFSTSMFHFYFSSLFVDRFTPLIIDIYRYCMERFIVAVVNCPLQTVDISLRLRAPSTRPTRDHMA